MLPFPDEAQARAALRAGRIQFYYVLAPGYLQSNQARVVYLQQPSAAAVGQFEDFLRVNLLSRQPPQVAERIARGSELVVRSADGRRQMSSHEWFNIFTPFAAGLAFIIAIFTSSGYLMQAIVEEKENRTMEIMVTSVSTAQMMSGKIIGNLAVGLTQLGLWLALAVLGVRIGRIYLDWMNGIALEPGLLVVILLVMAPGFVLIAALMATVGATVTDEREGQQVTGLFTLPVMVPYWLIAQLMGNPNGPLAVALSYFPLTAPVAMTIRAGFTTLPAEQVAASFCLLVLSALGALWLAGRAFQLGMLRYGKRLSWRELIGGGKAG
jgi:ABC-2 type transport system permease protein